MALDIKRFIGRFVEEARDHLTRLGEGLAALERDPTDRENVNALFRSAHTIKGSSRMLKLMTISDTAHSLEDLLGALREGRVAFDRELGGLLYRGIDALAALVDVVADGGETPAADEALRAALTAAAAGETTTTEPAAAPPPAAPPSPAAPPPPTEPPPETDAAADPGLKTPDTVRVRIAKLDELIKLMGEVISSHARLRQRQLEIRDLERGARETLQDDALAKGLHQFAQALRDDVSGQELLMGELHDKALLMRMLPLTIVFDPAARLVRDLARTIGKDVECVISGAEIELDRQLIDRLSDPVVHMLRNSVDHGIEPREERLARGKPAHGRIHLSARQDGGWVVIEVGDDGGGLPIEEIRAKAVRKGHLGAEEAAALGEAEVVDLIFLPGFSTSPIITDVSGRGVGMDVVKKSIVDELHGVVSVETRPGHGTRFILRLPLSLAVMRVLMCDVAGTPFGFTAQYIAGLLRLPAGSLMEVAGRRAVIVGNEFVPVVELAELLDPPNRPSHAAERAELLMVVVRVRNEKLALVVDDLLDERDMVIKPMPEHMRRLPLVSGMVVTGKSELVSILHVPLLLEMARDARGEARSATPAGGAEPREGGRHVLVVDDSLNTREIEKDVLEAHGYRVTLAEDGLDGWRKARAGRFDAILTDVEMPNMDGFTLTARLRGEEKFHDTPIIIVTSREKEEDKRRGIQVGADAYIVKGDFDQSSLIDTLRNLLG